MDSSSFDKGDELKGSDVEQVNESTLETDEGAVMRSRVDISVGHRQLNPRQIHLTALAGAMGAALSVAIGQVLFLDLYASWSVRRPIYRLTYLANW
jgi:amino acid permease